MTTFVSYDPVDGEIRTWGSTEDPDAQAVGGRVVLVDVVGSNDTHHVVEGVLVAYSDEQRAAKAARPDWPAVWSNETMTWSDERTLDEARADQRALVKAAREAAVLRGFTWEGSRFDADELSQQRIGSAVTLAMLAAQLGVPFNRDWTLFDNAIRTLSGSDMIQVGLACGQFVGEAFSTGQALQAQIEAATTVDEVKSIVWPS